ncbi:MAG TPA: hypothetical protein VIK14_02110 [Ignavibacteria bacterium]
MDPVEFFNYNWQNILITLAGGALFFIISYYYTEKVLDSAQKEKVKQAKITLLDILESKVINKQEISLETVLNLTDAINREYNVNLSKVTTPIYVLQDLDLIFEKSHHLDISQKAIYCDKIQAYIEGIKAKNEELRGKFEVSKDYMVLFEKLSNEIEINDSIGAKKTLNSLKTKISNDDISNKSYETLILRIFNKDFILPILPIISGLIATVIGGIILTFIQTKYFP